MKNIITYSFIALLCVSFFEIKAQDFVGELFFNIEQAQQYQLEKTYPQNKSNKKQQALTLPFFDDFSRSSLPTNNPNIPLEWQRWEDNNVFINSTFPIDPPTIGVATFDGLDATGYPYNFTSPGTAHIPSDTLTSVAIDLSEYDENDDVFLTFFVQSKGRGNSPDVPYDSLKLEFNVGNDGWVQKWIIPAVTPGPFQQYFVEIWDNEFGSFYFHENFQFRFIGYSEQRGNLDHWHLDYVYLNENIDPGNFTFQELAIMNPVNTLLNASLTAMPWTHFVDNPGAHMLNNTMTLYERNIWDNSFNFQSGYQVLYDGVLVDDIPNLDVNIGGNANSIIETAIDINTAASPFIFDTSVNDTCADFSVKFYHSNQDINFHNDTTTFTQSFRNYYAYDDGTAEKSFYLNQAGSKIAVKYDSYIPDTLLGILVHFVAFQNDHSDDSFILRAWADDNGQPGAELDENFTFHYPIYYETGYNKFSYYEFDNPMPVDGNFYVGWVQESNEHLNIGLDRNTNTNPFSLFYSLGLSNTWQNTSIEGSMMIRPVLKAGKENTSTSVEDNEATLDWSIRPNPTQSFLTIDVANTNHHYDYSIYDTRGRLITSKTKVSSNTSLNVSSWSDGLYFIQITTESGKIFREEFLKTSN